MEKILTNPFADDPLPKAFYYPTRSQELSDGQKKTALEPDRLMYGGDIMTEKEQALLDSEFLKGTHTFKSRLMTTKDALNADTSEKFDESWPTSEKPSEISIPELDLPASKVEAKYREKKEKRHDRFMQPERDTSSKKSTRAPGGKTSESTLAKYIDRFRHGTPMSREERDKTHQQAQQDKAADFWWISDQSKISEPSDTSTPIDKNGVRTRRRTPQNGGDYSTSTAQAETTRSDRNSTGVTLTLNEFMKQEKEREKGIRRRGPGTDGKLDDSIYALQEKADRLLERSSSSMGSTGPMVSTQGLGSTMSSTTPRSVDEVAYRPEFTKKSVGATLPSEAFVKGGDDDILTQWRRRRKVEEMKERAEMGGPISKTATNLMPKNEQLDWKVQAFRQKLQDALALADSTGQSLNGPRAQHGASTSVAANVSFTPAPSSKATSVSQTEIAVQTSPAVTTVRQAPAHSHSPIASPHLPQTTRDPTRPDLHGTSKEVEPHMHLSCDIIQCPHERHSDFKTENESNSRKTNHLKSDAKQGKSGPKRDQMNKGDHPVKESTNEQAEQRVNRQKQPANQGVTFETEHDDSIVVAPPASHHHGVSDMSFEQLKARHLRSLQQQENLQLNDLSFSTDDETLAKRHKDTSKQTASDSNQNGYNATTSGARQTKTSEPSIKSASARESKHSRTKRIDVEIEEYRGHASDTNLDDYSSNTRNNHSQPTRKTRDRREHGPSQNNAQKQSRSVSNPPRVKENSDRSRHASGDAQSDRVPKPKDHVSSDKLQNSRSHDENHRRPRDKNNRSRNTNVTRDKSDRYREHSKEKPIKPERDTSIEFKKPQRPITDDSVQLSVDSFTDVSDLDQNISSSFLQRQQKMTALSQQMSEGRVSEVSEEERSESIRSSNEKQQYFADNSDLDSPSHKGTTRGGRKDASEKRPQRKPTKPKSSRHEPQPQFETTKELPKPKKSASAREEGPSMSKSQLRASQNQPCSVVGNRLFTDSTSIMMSSVEDSFLDTPTPLELANRGKSSTEGAIDELAQAKPEEQDDPDLEDALLSDGEDYQEDDILRDLRTKRLFLIHKLKSIDKILSEQEGS